MRANRRTPIPTAERVRELLIYNPETGMFYHRVSRSGVRAGDVAGYVAPVGYIYISVDGVGECAHRLAWLYVTGEWPAHEIDHRNRIRTNNSWENLRAASDAEQQINVADRANNTSGFTGVARKRARWRAFITVSGKQLNLGSYEHIEDAVRARQSAVEQHYGEFAVSA